MYFEKTLALLSRCYNKFISEYNDHNFKLVTHKNVTVMFNFRQSKLVDFLGIAEKFLRIDRDGDYQALRKLANEKNRGYYVDLFSSGNYSYGEFFDGDAVEKMFSFLDLQAINAYNAKFLVFCSGYDDNEHDCYLFINGKNTSKNGFFIALDKSGKESNSGVMVEENGKGKNYYNPKKIIRVNNISEFLNIATKGEIQIISVVNNYSRIEDKFINTRKKDNEFMDIDAMLVRYGIEGFNFSADDILNIRFDTQRGITKTFCPSQFGYNLEGNVVVSKPALTIIGSQAQRIEQLQNMLFQLGEEYRILLENSYGILDELYDKTMMLEQNGSISENPNEPKSKLLRKLRSIL